MENTPDNENRKNSPSAQTNMSFTEQPHLEQLAANDNQPQESVTGPKTKGEASVEDFLNTPTEELNLNQFSSQEEFEELLTQRPDFEEVIRKRVQEKYPDINDNTGFAQVMLIELSSMNPENELKKQLMNKFIEEEKAKIEQNKEDFEKANFIVKIIMILLGYTNKHLIELAEEMGFDPNNLQGEEAKQVLIQLEKKEEEEVVWKDRGSDKKVEEEPTEKSTNTPQLTHQPGTPPPFPIDKAA